MTKKEILIQDALGTIEPRNLSMDDLIYLAQYRKRPEGLIKGLINRIHRKLRVHQLKMYGWRNEDFKYETYVKCLQQLGVFPYDQK